MVGERNQHAMLVHVPPWTFADDPTAIISPFSPLSPNATHGGGGGGGSHHHHHLLEDYSYFLRNDAALRRYLDDDFDECGFGSGTGSGSDLDFSSEAFACDSFRMYEFKIRKCTRGRSHDWTDCPYAHPGEKARRRDPRRYSYSGTACPEFRKGNCKKGDACEFSHGVFECWLHPQRYRTQPCKDGLNCRRRVCFFAHTAEQLRVLSPQAESYDGSPLKGFPTFFSSPSEASSPPSESPPMSPMDGSINDVLSSLRRLQLSKSLQTSRISSTLPGFFSLPSTPTRVVTRPGFGLSEIWEKGYLEEEPAMERVESGRGLRVKMFEKLSKENPLDGSDPDSSPEPNLGESSNPDVGWISELVK